MPTVEAPSAELDRAHAPESPVQSPVPAPTASPVAPRAARPTSKPNPPSKQPFLPGQRAPKAPRTDETERTRLWLSAGESTGVTRDAVIRCIQGETGLPAEVVHRVDIRERHTFVDVAAEHAAAILSKLKRASLGGTRLKAKVA
jgi:ATP-dependent RNA helicase DeaD